MGEAPAFCGGSSGTDSSAAVFSEDTDDHGILAGQNLCIMTEYAFGSNCREREVFTISSRGGTGAGQDVWKGSGRGKQAVFVENISLILHAPNAIINHVLEKAPCDLNKTG